MKDTTLIPFIGIGSLGAMAINNIPPDIHVNVFTVFLSRKDVCRNVNDDFRIEYTYNWTTKQINDDFIRELRLLLEWNTNRIFIVVNLGGEASTACALKIAEFLYSHGKNIILHVSTPFHFQCNESKQKAKNAIVELRKFASDLSIGDNGDILKQCSHDINFLDFLSFRSVIIFNEFRKKFGFKEISNSCLGNTTNDIEQCSELEINDVSNVNSQDKYIEICPKYSSRYELNQNLNETSLFAFTKLRSGEIHDFSKNTDVQIIYVNNSDAGNKFTRKIFEKIGKFFKKPKAKNIKIKSSE